MRRASRTARLPVVQSLKNGVDEPFRIKWNHVVVALSDAGEHYGTACGVGYRQGSTALGVGVEFA